jgi:hypothetical protein
MPLEWNFWYARWMIEDGLPNRSVGDEFSWFIEFGVPNGLSWAREQGKKATPLPDYRYRIVAEVRSIHESPSIAERACVIDFGLKVVGDPSVLPLGCKPGEYVCGELSLFLTHGHAIPLEESFESLKRRWHVNAIQADVTPRIPHPEHGGSVRDESRIKYQAIWSTTSAKADDYILHCSETL